MEQREVLPNVIRERAENSPDQPFVRDVSGEARTNAEFWDGVLRWATMLRGQGVEEGDRVVVMLPTSVEAYEVWCAVAALHAIEVPINTQYVGNILAYVVNNSSAKVAVCAGRYLDAMVAQSGQYEHLKTLIVSDAEEAPALSDLDALPGALLHREATPLKAPEPVQPWEIGSILYTSGTTGPSKGVLVPWAQAHATATGAAPERSLRAPDVIYYSPYPSFHVSGKAPFYGVALGGGRFIVRERFDTNAFWDDIREHSCNYTMLMGATANFMFRQPPREDDADNPLRGVIFSPWIAEVEDFKSRFGIEAYSVFNMTEISAPIVGGWDNEPITDPKSCGKGRSGYQLRVVDDNDDEVPPGTPGELIVRTDEPWTLMAGYWQMPEKTVEAWRNQWLHTGDLFSVDEEGNYYYLDRKKDSIRRRGENISSMEIEEIVLNHEEVLEVAAVAVPDEISEEEVKIVVVLKPGANEDAEGLAGYLADRLPRFMVPRYIEFDQELPKTPTEKVRKSVLRERGVSDRTWDRNAGITRAR